MPNATHHRTPPSLRRTWLYETLGVVTLFVLLGAVAVAASAYQRATFRETTGDVQRASGAVVSLRGVLNVIDDSSTPVMYKMAGSQQAHLARFRKDSRDVTAAFERVHGAVPAEAVPAVERAQRNWATMRSMVEAAPAMHAGGGIAEMLAAGADPFKPAWDQYGSINDELATIERVTVQRMSERAATADRLQGYIPPALLAAMSLALGLVWTAARRVSRRIVRPVAELRRAALAMRDAKVCADIDVRRASAEIQVLAQTIQDTAASLAASHGELREQAYTDVLTGLPNRKAFVEELERRFGNLTSPVGVLFVDLDDFKVVNDSLGHAAGDELLRVVAARLRKAVRGDDLVARLGGDEFAVLVSVTGSAAVTAVAANVLAALDDEVVLGDTRVSIGCSVGAASSGGGASSADALLRNADFAMYTAKGRGKNCVETFTQSMHLAMQAQTDLKHDLSRAVARGELVLHHQPVLDLAEGQVLGFEALVRWNHPVRGLVPPMEFITLAEETGDIVEIGNWVLGQACRDLAEYRRDHSRDDLWMSVNVSPLQLMAPAFVDAVVDTLARHDIPASSLILEITEHAAVSNTAAANVVLEALRDHGVRIALDDFGVGFSSLRYLCELPVDVIKIDRSFVAETGERGDAMLTAIVSLARKMRLSVIAEGIEEPEQLERLRQFGELAGQGYLFARPMPAGDAGLALGDDPPHGFAVKAASVRRAAVVPHPRSPGHDTAFALADLV